MSERKHRKVARGDCGNNADRVHPIRVAASKEKIFHKFSFESRNNQKKSQRALQNVHQHGRDDELSVLWDDQNRYKLKKSHRSNNSRYCKVEDSRWPMIKSPKE